MLTQPTVQMAGRNVPTVFFTLHNIVKPLDTLATHTHSSKLRKKFLNLFFYTKIVNLHQQLTSFCNIVNCSALIFSPIHLFFILVLNFLK